MKNKRTIGFISVIIIIIILIILIKDYSLFNRNERVEVLLRDTIYVEETRRDSINTEIDSIVLSIDKNDRNEKEFYENISDSDSMSIVRNFIQLCTE